jgi:folate-binding protein YgfZ
MTQPLADPPAFLPLAGRAVLAIGGPDRRGFLQGLISNDIARATASCAIHAALLTPQGRFLHDFAIVEHADRLLLDAEAAGIDALAKRLTMYRLRSKSSIEILADWGVAALLGPEATRAIGLSGPPGTAIAFAGGVAFVDPRLAELGGRIVAPAARLEDAASFGLRRGADEAYDALRLRLGVPDGTRDLADALLMENGFDAMNAIDWKKGCYVGQEVTARMRYRGLVKKRLVPVRIDGAAPPPGSIVTFDGAEAGEMRSASGSRGLALLRIDALVTAASTGRGFDAASAVLNAEVPAWLAEPDTPET